MEFSGIRRIKGVAGGDLITVEYELEGVLASPAAVPCTLASLCHPYTHNTYFCVWNVFSKTRVAYKNSVAKLLSCGQIP